MGIAAISTDNLFSFFLHHYLEIYSLRYWYAAYYETKANYLSIRPGRC